MFVLPIFLPSSFLQFFSLPLFSLQHQITGKGRKWKSFCCSVNLLDFSCCVWMCLLVFLYAVPLPLTVSQTRWKCKNVERKKYIGLVRSIVLFVLMYRDAFKCFRFHFFHFFSSSFFPTSLFLFFIPNFISFFFFPLSFAFLLSTFPLLFFFPS